MMISLLLISNHEVTLLCDRSSNWGWWLRREAVPLRACPGWKAEDRVRAASSNCVTFNCSLIKDEAFTRSRGHSFLAFVFFSKWWYWEWNGFVWHVLLKCFEVRGHLDVTLFALITTFVEQLICCKPPFCHLSIWSDIPSSYLQTCVLKCFMRESTT